MEALVGGFWPPPEPTITAPSSRVTPAARAIAAAATTAADGTLIATSLGGAAEGDSTGSAYTCSMRKRTKRRGARAAKTDGRRSHTTAGLERHRSAAGRQRRNSYLNRSGKLKKSGLKLVKFKGSVRAKAFRTRRVGVSEIDRPGNREQVNLVYKTVRQWQSKVETLHLLATTS